MMRSFTFCVAATVGLLFTATAAHAGGFPLGNAFTYQGQLKLSGNPVNASADFQFTLFDALAGPNQIGAMQQVNNVSVINGVFTNTLDFGFDSFDGNERFLEIAVRSPAGSGVFTTLMPRQKLNAAPYALQTRGLFVSSSNNLAIGHAAPMVKLHVLGGGDASLADTSGYCVLGDVNGLNLVLDQNEVMARTNGDVTTLTLNNEGGNIVLGNSTSDVSVEGELNIGFSTLTFGPLDVTDTGGVVASFRRDGADGTVLLFLNDSVQAGTISVAGATVSYNAFTGSHYAWTDRAIEQFSLVRMTGDNRRHQRNADGEITYGIEPVASANDPACLGAYLGLQDSSLPIGDDNPHLVMAVGNGEMFIVDSGQGDIQPGDHLISADTAGCAMKDDPQRFPIGYIVARAGEAADWSTIDSPADGSAKRRKISVFFESFVRDSRGANLGTLVAAQQREIESLKARIESLSDLAARIATLEANDRRDSK